MRPTTSRLTSSLLALSLAACAADDANPGREAAQFAILTERGTSARAHEAWYTWASGISYEAVGTVAAEDVFHHVDIMDYRTGDLPALALDQTYTDGPTVDDRGVVGDYVNAEGVLAGDFPVPWIDVVTCDGDIYQAPATCVTAERVDVTLTEVDGGVKLTYAATLPSGTIAAGSFVGRPGTLHGDPR